jgi:predicted transcriptional regulator of viral defense system
MSWVTANLLARASRVADPYYIGFATAASHYGLTTQQRNIISFDEFV